MSKVTDVNFGIVAVLVMLLFYLLITSAQGQFTPLDNSPNEIQRVIKWESDRTIAGTHIVDGTSPDWVVVDIGTTDYTVQLTGAGNQVLLDSAASNCTADSFKVLYIANGLSRINYLVIRDR